MVVLDVANPYFANLAQGAEEHLMTLGTPLLLGNSSNSAARESSYLDLFEQQRVSGILLTPVGDVLPRLARLKARGSAVVVLDHKLESEEFSSVSVDDELGGWLVVDHLISQGAERIAIIGGPQHLRQVYDRVQGAERRAARSPGAVIQFFDTGAMTSASGREMVQRLLEQPSSAWPDAIFATNDLVALGALQVLIWEHISVPHQIMLIGFDDIEFAANATVPISSVRRPSFEMGRWAAELLSRAEERPTAQAQHTIFQPELAVRQSSQANGAF